LDFDLQSDKPTGMNLIIALFLNKTEYYRKMIMIATVH